MQRKTPMFHEAQRGCLLRLQSAQVLFDSSLTSCLSVARFCSARSGAVGTRRDIVVVQEVELEGRVIAKREREPPPLWWMMFELGEYSYWQSKGLDVRGCVFSRC